MNSNSQTRVWIAYDPYLFREALTTILAQIDSVEIIDTPTDEVDIGIFRLAETGQLQDFFRHRSLPEAKMIVFSPHGDHAFIRLPGETNWKESRPFGIDQLKAEIKAGRNKRADRIPTGFTD
jgi:hypothetical protein